MNDATPGWASTLSSALLIVVLQSFLISLFLVFMVLQYRTQQQFIPVLQYRDFIEKVEEL
jgi:polyisoprenyl-phosphate glycosyltransferase